MENHDPQPISLEFAKRTAEQLGFHVCRHGNHSLCNAFVPCTGECDVDPVEWERLMELRATSKSDYLGVFKPVASYPSDKYRRLKTGQIKHMVERQCHKYISNAAIILYLAAVGVEMKPLHSEFQVLVKATAVRGMDIYVGGAN